MKIVRTIINWAMGLVLFSLVVGLVMTVVQQDDTTKVLIAAMSQMDEEGAVATGVYGSVRLRGFDWENKRCLWATDGGHQSGLTCWDAKP